MKHLNKISVIERTERYDFEEAVASKLQHINDSEGSILSTQYQYSDGIYSCMIHYATQET